MSEGSGFEGRHEKGGAFLSSAMPGELTRPPGTDTNVSSIDTGVYIMQSYRVPTADRAEPIAAKPVPFDQEADDPRMQFHSRR